jgi:PAS domain-containing protein
LTDADGLSNRRASHAPLNHWKIRLLLWPCTCPSAHVSVSDCSFPSAFLYAARGSQDSADRPHLAVAATLHPQTSAKPRTASWQFIGAVTPVAIIIFILEVLHLCGLAIPYPGVPLFCAILYASFLAGWRAGLLGTASAVLYELLTFSDGHLFAYTWQSAIRIATFASVALTAAILAGMLKRRSEAATYLLACNWAAESLAVQSARLQEVLHQLPLGVLVSDADSGEIVFANEHARSVLGYDLKRIHSVGQPCVFHAAGGKSYGKAYIPDEWPWRRCIRLRMPVEEELLYAREDGRLVVLAARACPVPGQDGQPVAAVVSFSVGTKKTRPEKRTVDHVPQPAVLEQITG